MNYSKLILATEAGKLHIFDNGEQKTVFQHKGTGGAMGIIVDDNHIYTSYPNQLLKIKIDGFELVKKSKIINADFHHMNRYDTKIYVSGTKDNNIYIFNNQLELLDKKLVKPPNSQAKATYKSNYNHINTVIKDGDNFLVNLNWSTKKQYGMSGYAVFDKNWKELERVTLGWESHDLQKYGDGFVVICATSRPEKNVQHPKKSGLMIDGELVFEHPIKEFCKALTWDKNYFYLCGGIAVRKEKRKDGNGIIYVIDKNTYQLVEKFDNFGVHNIKGVRLWEK